MVKEKFGETSKTLKILFKLIVAPFRGNLSNIIFELKQICKTVLTKKKKIFELSQNPAFYISIENLKEIGASYEERLDSKNNRWQNILQKHQKNLQKEQKL